MAWALFGPALAGPVPLALTAGVVLATAVSGYKAGARQFDAVFAMGLALVALFIAIGFVA